MKYLIAIFLLSACASSQNVSSEPSTGRSIWNRMLSGIGGAGSALSNTPHTDTHLLQPNWVNGKIITTN